MSAVTQRRTSERKAAAKPATKGGRSAEWSFVRFYEFDPIQRVQVIKQGLPAGVPGAIAERMGISKDRLYATLGLARATVERKLRESKPLSPEESSRVLGMGRLVGQVQRMVEESGRPEGFDAAAWVARWMERPVPALAGRRPAELMDTAEGQALVANVLARAQSGAYA